MTFIVIILSMLPNNQYSQKSLQENMLKLYQQLLVHWEGKHNNLKENLLVMTVEEDFLKKYIVDSEMVLWCF